MVEVPRTSQHDGLGSVSTAVEIDCHDPGLAAGESFSNVAYRGLGSWLCKIAVRLWDLHSGSQEDLQGRQPLMDLIIQVNEPSVREVQFSRDLSLAEGCDLWRSYGDLRSHLEGMVDDPLFGYTGFAERGGPPQRRHHVGDSEGGEVVYGSGRIDLMTIVGFNDMQL
ncbi:hypothetical protein NE237_010468 [Protea cynaroides]|uniref:Uncharacterized protein n=1 Tax=Protea cynaroides TaxID=273540 RepID=A0A9Q0KZD8_9MAGN|nr:hypothetical protein NE237_010468 [Protea cynaroides]